MLKTEPDIVEYENKIFNSSYYNFNEIAIKIFQAQYRDNLVYREYVDLLKVDTEGITTIEAIPYLPISFFKNYEIKTTSFHPEIVFTSSGTTGGTTSNHHIKKLSLYEKSFMRCFQIFYDDPKKFSFLALLPGYLENNTSSLIEMMHHFIARSQSDQNGFFANDHEKLYQTLVHNELMKIPTILWGVTFSLLDFAEKYSMKLRHTIIIETGGMKGRREEITRDEIHTILEKSLGVDHVHSEYGMTELLSQAYSKKDGLFQCPPWMKILIRGNNDPMEICALAESKPASGLINVIDMANLYSCSFIATDDVGRLHKNGSFEVLGRSDSSDLRGCSLLSL